MPVVAVANTHAHYDRTFGNQVFTERDIPIYGHRLILDHYAQYEAPRLAAVKRDPQRKADKYRAYVSLTLPSVLVDSLLQLEPGGRTLMLIPLEPGHTDTEVAVLVPDARVWFRISRGPRLRRTSRQPSCRRLPMRSSGHTGTAVNPKP